MNFLPEKKNMGYLHIILWKKMLCAKKVTKLPDLTVQHIPYRRESEYWMNTRWRQYVDIRLDLNRFRRARGEMGAFGGVCLQLLGRFLGTVSRDFWLSSYLIKCLLSYFATFFNSAPTTTLTCHTPRVHNRLKVRKKTFGIKISYDNVIFGFFQVYRKFLNLLVAFEKVFAKKCC